MKKILLLWLLSQQIAFAQFGPISTLQMDSLLQAYEATKQFSGVVLVARHDDILYEKAIGYADRERQIPNTIGTNFNIASMGKTFTATLIMQLVQEGKLDLRQNLALLLPEYSIKNAADITVYHLLTHTSGVGNYMMHPRFEAERFQVKTLDEVMPYVVDMEPTLEKVGERMDYSNSGFIILGKIVEKITGRSYLQNLEDRIFKKAGIGNSYLHYPATFEAPQEAVPYLAYTGKTYVNVVREEFPGFSDGGMQSNVRDLRRFAAALLNGKLLQPEWRDSMWRGKVLMDPRSGTRYGFGWMDNPNEFGKQIYSHDGGGKGFSADLKVVRDDGYVIAVLINGRVNPREVSDNLLRIIYQGTFRQPEKYMEVSLMEKVEEKGFDFVRENYSKILQEHGFSQTPNPWIYVQFADMFENLQDFEKAGIVLKMSRAEFPEAAIVYNATGKLLVTQSKFGEAAEWFQKALAIDPNDGFAKMMLAQIAGR